MKLVTLKEFISTIKVICSALLLAMPLLSNAQNTIEIKDFHLKLTFTHTYALDLVTNIRSDSMSNLTFIAIYNIDEKGQGTFEFNNEALKSRTLVRINHSQIKKINKMVYLTIGGELDKKPEKIMTTISIFPESNEVDRLLIYNPTQKKAFVFY